MIDTVPSYLDENSSVAYVKNENKEIHNTIVNTKEDTKSNTNTHTNSNTNTAQAQENSAPDVSDTNTHTIVNTNRNTDTQAESLGVISVTSQSPNNPLAACTGSILPVRLNDYQRDILDLATKQKGINKSAFIRDAFLTEARKMGIF